MCRIFHVAHLAALDRNARCRGCVFGAGGQFDFRNGRNRSKRFTAKTKRADRDEIFAGANLRRRVTLERKDRIVAHHAFAVIRDLQQAASTGFDLDRDARGARVDRIFDELFGDGSGTLNDFARGDLISDVICEDANFGH